MLPAGLALTSSRSFPIVVSDEYPGALTDMRRDPIDRRRSDTTLLFRKPATAKVTIKLFSGINRDIGLTEYDPSRGIEIDVRDGTRLKKALKRLGMRKLMHNAYFQNGERAGLWSRLRDGDEISCIKPSAGG
jgi:hypothetical protein